MPGRLPERITHVGAGRPRASGPGRPAVTLARRRPVPSQVSDEGERRRQDHGDGEGHPSPQPNKGRAVRRICASHRAGAKHLNARQYVPLQAAIAAHPDRDEVRRGSSLRPTAVDVPPAHVRGPVARPRRRSSANPPPPSSVRLPASGACCGSGGPAAGPLRRRRRLQQRHRTSRRPPRAPPPQPVAGSAAGPTTRSGGPSSAGAYSGQLTRPIAGPMSPPKYKRVIPRTITPCVTHRPSLHDATPAMLTT